MYKTSLMSATALCALLAGPAFAQTTTPTEPAQVEELVVTGSRVVRDGFQAPTPVTVVGVEQLKEQAVTRLVDVSRNLPIFRNQGGARSVANASANAGQGSLNMRGLGGNRNLVLLDRRRVVPSTGNGIVDVNVLPSALISRVEVVTGGASAAWGSDAVSGVINFVLDSKFAGVKAEVSGGVSGERDNEEFNLSLAGGRAALGGRAHVIGSLEYFRAGGQKLMDRDWLARRPGIINNPAYTTSNTETRQFVVDGNIVSAYMSRGGLVDGCRNAGGANIANCSLRGLAFGPGGSVHNFVYGTYVNPTGNMLAPASDPNGDYTQIYDNIMMVNPSERVSAFAHAGYDLTDTTTAFVEGLYTESVVGPSYAVPPYRFGTSATTWLSVSADNAFLPASVKAQMSGPGGGNSTGPAFLNIGRINDDWVGNSKIRNTNTTKRFVAGLDGRIRGDWTWDAYYQYGENTYYGTVESNLITSRGGLTALGNVNLAVDAVVAPAGNAAGIAPGTIVCRSTLTSPNNGCVPLNIFGVGAASPEAIRYVLGTQWTEQTYKQNVVEVATQGELFSTWAGPVSVAAGLSYRAEEIAATVDSLSLESAFGIGNPKPYSGEYNVREGFTEVVIPLAKDVPLAKSADLTLAGRVTDYSTSGTVKTWKIGLTYQPVEDIRLRFTQSLDIRAPSLQELYTGATQARAGVIDRFKSSSTTVNIQQIGGGNADLVPEEATTFSGGVVYSPSFLRGFTASADYYDIKIENVIGTLSSQQIVDRCFAGNTALCNQITRQNGDIIEIRSTNLNLNRLRAKGWDFEVGYRTALEDFSSLTGNVGVRVLANYVDEFSRFDGVTTLDDAGAAGQQQPRWTTQIVYFYDHGPFRATVNHRYVGKGVIDNAFNVAREIDNNNVKSRLYTNLNLNYKVDKLPGQNELYLNIDNLFDVKPPKGFGWGYGANASPQYDTIGRMFKIGFRARY